MNAGTNQPLLAIRGLCKNFGGLQAVADFSMDLAPGELKGLIGPNGAGKSTVFNLISGLHKPSGGSVQLDGENITGLTPDRICRKGVARTFQIVKLLENISVLEIMRTSFFLSAGYHVLDALLLTERYRRREKEIEDQARRYLSLLGVDHLVNKNGNELAFGLQRKVDLARTLALSPRLLLLDEPMCGLNQTEKSELCDIILRLKESFGLSIILVEHDMKVIMDLCPSIVVMNQGQVIAEGSSGEVRRHPQVIEAYLGTGAA
ncbi:MAG: ABC transporter ATP-binding protein [Thermodesulfobacteriota bacterium]